MKGRGVKSIGVLLKLTTLMNTDRGGKMFEFIEFNPFAENFACACSRDTRAIFSNYYVVLLLTRTISYMYFVLARVFGDFYFMSCYLPLFSFNLFGLNLEFERTIRRELFLTTVTCDAWETN